MPFAKHALIRNVKQAANTQNHTGVFLLRGICPQNHTKIPMADSMSLSMPPILCTDICVPALS